MSSPTCLSTRRKAIDKHTAVQELPLKCSPDRELLPFLLLPSLQDGLVREENNSTIETRPPSGAYYSLILSMLATVYSYRPFLQYGVQTAAANSVHFQKGNIVTFHSFSVKAPANWVVPASLCLHLIMALKMAWSWRWSMNSPSSGKLLPSSLIK
jgi:hypothetical protein